MTDKKPKRFKVGDRIVEATPVRGGAGLLGDGSSYRIDVDGISRGFISYGLVAYAHKREWHSFAHAPSRVEHNDRPYITTRTVYTPGNSLKEKALAFPALVDAGKLPTVEEAQVELAAAVARVEKKAKAVAKENANWRVAEVDRKQRERESLAGLQEIRVRLAQQLTNAETAALVEAINILTDRVHRER